ncbi:hypothetical protein VD0002_g7508 [Verticillium dahliae]|nr:hypothetical protein VD0002_g7508 [Verticillium dahliae]
MATPVAGYKPSPLGYGSPRSSPFRRPESPASPSSPSLRQTTPSASPTKTPSRTSRSSFAEPPTTPPRTADSWTPRALPQTPPRVDMQASPKVATRSSPVKTTAMNGNALSQLQPTQVRTLREGFEILDRDSDGVVNREDVADMLTQLGLPANASDVSKFFPPSAPQTMTMAVFLNTLAAMLATLSPQAELLSAFSAFDDDDSGQIDLAELRDALLNTAPEPGERALTPAEVDQVMQGFTGRRAFSRNMQGGLGKRGEVFRYQEFVNSVMGSNNGTSEAASAETSEN